MVRTVLVTALLAACSKRAASPPPPPPPDAAPPPDASDRVSAGEVTALAYPDLASALEATIPADARVVGFGELHARTDRGPVKSALAAFTEVLPTFAGRLSDLVVETWLVDPKCGQQAKVATQKLETTVARPAATKSEIALLADAARAGQVQPHAMTIGCKDYELLAPSSGEADPIAMLTITTRELTRISTSAVTHRDKLRGTDAGVYKPWVALYGGALHNDRFPSPGVEEWSYADRLDLATDGHYIEVDLIVPELAEQDSTSQQQPWFPLVAAVSSRVLVWPRGERSFVVLLPRGPR